MTLVRRGYYRIKQEDDELFKEITIPMEQIHQKLSPELKQVIDTLFSKYVKAEEFLGLIDRQMEIVLHEYKFDNQEDYLYMIKYAILKALKELPVSLSDETENYHFHSLVSELIQLIYNKYELNLN